MTYVAEAVAAECAGQADRLIPLVSRYTAFLFFYTPLAASASPRNAIRGHLIGVCAGWISLALFGLVTAGPALSAGVSAGRVGAAALSLGLTAGVMVWLRVPHPPAGATTMIVSLGLLTRPVALAVLMAAVVLLTVQAIVINRLAGLDYPLWAPHPSHRAPEAVARRRGPEPRASTAPVEVIPCVGNATGHEQVT